MRQRDININLSGEEGGGVWEAGITINININKNCVHLMGRGGGGVLERLATQLGVSLTPPLDFSQPRKTFKPLTLLLLLQVMSNITTHLLKGQGGFSK